MPSRDLVAQWAREAHRRTCRDGQDPFTYHEQTFGCTVTIFNVRVETVELGGCGICGGHREQGVLFDFKCSCPTRIPQVKNPDKTRRNPNRLTGTSEIATSEPISISEIVNEVNALGQAEESKNERT